MVIKLTFGSNRIKQSGLFDKVVHSLQSNNVAYVEFGGIISNPLLSKVYEGIELAKHEKIDAILSVGGGSVLDSSKAIAAGTLYDGDVWDFFSKKANIKNAVPIFSILTLAATGSEMNGGAVITNDDTKQKWSIYSQYTYPKISVINPELMHTVTKDYLVYSAADIIAHVIEIYFTAKYHPEIQSRLVESVIKTVINTTEKLILNPRDYNARAEFAWAATLALNGLTGVGTSDFSHPNHMMEHSLSALHNVPHGAGLSVIMPAWMKWYYRNNENQFIRFAHEIFGESGAIEGIASFENWLNKIGTPTKLSQLNITSDDLDDIVENIVDNARYGGVADVYTKEVIRTILNYAL